MKTKALILGATPPFEGPVVDLSEVKAWEIVVTTLPINSEVDGTITVEWKEIETSVIPLTNDLKLTGAFNAKVKLCSGASIVSISATEIEDVDEAA